MLSNCLYEKLKIAYDKLGREFEMQCLKIFLMIFIFILAMNNSIAYYISSYDFHSKGTNISRHIPEKPPVMTMLLTILSYRMIV